MLNYNVVTNDDGFLVKLNCFSYLAEVCHEVG